MSLLVPDHPDFLTVEEQDWLTVGLVDRVPGTEKESARRASSVKVKHVVAH